MNLKDELLNHIRNRDVYCADLFILKERGEVGLSYFTKLQVSLPTGFIESDWNNFLKSLDDNLKNLGASDRLFGTIWYSDVTWSTKGTGIHDEWKYHKYPTVPTYLY